MKKTSFQVLVYSALKRAILDSEQGEAGKRRREEVVVVDSEEEEEVRVVEERVGGVGLSSSRGRGGSRDLLGEGGSGGGVGWRRGGGCGDRGRKRSGGGEEGGGGRVVTSLRALSVVDRRLKPHYLLEAAPSLTRLAIDWQVSRDFCFSANWICFSLHFLKTNQVHL